MNTPTLVASLVMAGVMALIVLVLFWRMLKAMARRAREQLPLIGALPPLPDTVGPAIIPEMEGLYVGSTIVPDRLQRIIVDDLGDQAKAALTRYPEGIMLRRTGGRPIWIPDDAITEIRTEDFIAGKAVPRNGILAIRWRLPSGTEIDTAFRGNDRTQYADWMTAR